MHNGQHAQIGRGDRGCPRRLVLSGYDGAAPDPDLFAPAAAVAVEMIRGALVATFVLRPRPEHECASSGERAAAADLIEDGRIRAWQQVPPPPPADASGVAA